MLREGVVEAGIDQKVSEAGMVYPVDQHGEIARPMIAIGLLGACRVEVQAGVHVDNAGLNGHYGDVTGMRQYVVPVGKRRGRNRIRAT